MYSHSTHTYMPTCMHVYKCPISLQDQTNATAQSSSQEQVCVGAGGRRECCKDRGLEEAAGTSSSWLGLIVFSLRRSGSEIWADCYSSFGDTALQGFPWGGHPRPVAVPMHIYVWLRLLSICRGHFAFRCFGFHELGLSGKVWILSDTLPGFCAFCMSASAKHFCHRHLH